MISFNTVIFAKLVWQRKHGLTFGV